MTQIDRNSSLPLYEQIRVILRDQIVAGEYKPDDLLPTERELCELYNVSRITVVRALNELALEGFVRRVQGKGTMVVSRPIEENLNSIRGFSRSMARRGLNVTSKLLSSRMIERDTNLNQIFRLSPEYDGGFVRIRRLRYVNDKPAAVFTTFVMADLGRRVLERDLENVSLYQLYHELIGVSISRSEVVLVPITATPEIIRWFDVKPGSAHFWHRSVSYADETPIETTSAIFRGDMFEFKSTLLVDEQDSHTISPWFVREETAYPLWS